MAVERCLRAQRRLHDGQRPHHGDCNLRASVLAPVHRDLSARGDYVVGARSDFSAFVLIFFDGHTTSIMSVPRRNCIRSGGDPA